MKHIKNMVISLIAVLGIGGMLFAAIMPQTVSAAAAPVCDQGFLTFPAWYKGLTKSDCSIINPSSLNTVTTTIKKGVSKTTIANDGLSKFIWTIVLNIIQIGLQLVGYAAAVLIVFGGFKFITSAGDSAAVASARSTVANASIGLVISIASVAIINLIVGIMGNSIKTATIGVTDIKVAVPKLTTFALLQNGLNIAYFAVGAVAMIMIIMSGLTYVTSGGDSATVLKAKNTILYSVIGLVVVVVAFAITQFILGSFGVK